MTTVGRLQSWYSKQCNGEWEHSYGVRIGTLDNPGWSVEIDLAGTSLADRPLEKIQRDSGTDWILCELYADQFRGFGGPSNLGEILDIFLSWAE